VAVFPIIALPNPSSHQGSQCFNLAKSQVYTDRDEQFHPFLIRKRMKATSFCEEEDKKRKLKLSPVKNLK